MIEYFNRLKSERKMTNQQISDASGVPISTVNRIMSGHSKNPGHEAIMSICAALGGSIGDIQADANTAARNENINEALSRVLDGYEQQFERERESYESIIRTKDKWIRNLAIMLFVVIMAVLLFSLIDFFNRNVGWLRRIGG